MYIQALVGLEPGLKLCGDALVNELCRLGYDSLILDIRNRAEVKEFHILARGGKRPHSHKTRMFPYLKMR